jgi:hypothetical protein
MKPSPSPVAEAFGLGVPTGPLVAIPSGPSAVANWLELNVRRSLDQAADRPFRLRAEAEVAGALAELSRRLVRLDRWTELLG